jgi:hypothetical protein
LDAEWLVDLRDYVENADIAREMLVGRWLVNWEVFLMSSLPFLGQRTLTLLLAGVVRGALGLGWQNQIFAFEAANSLIVEQATDIAVTQRVEQWLSFWRLAFHRHSQRQIVDKLILAYFLKVEAVFRDTLVDVVVTECSLGLGSVFIVEGLVGNLCFAFNCENRYEYFC